MARKRQASFGQVKAVLFYTGVTPNKPGEVPTVFNRIRRAIPLLAAAYNIYCFIILLISIYQTRDDLEKAAVYFANLCFRLLIISKFGGLYYQEGRISKAIQEIEYLFNDLVREDDAMIRRGLWIMVGIEKLGVLFWLLVCAMMLTQVPGMFAARSMYTFHYHPYDITQSPMCEITIVTEETIAMLGFGYIIIVDCTMLSFLVHLIAVARSLGKRILYISDSAKKSIQGLRVVRRTINFPGSLTLQHGSEFHETTLSSNRPVQGRSRKNHQVVVSRGQGVAGVGGLKSVALAVGRKEEVNTALELILAKCVEQHQRLIKLVHEINSIGKTALLVQLFINFLAGLCVLYITVFEKKIEVREILILFLMFGLYVELFLLCFLADILTDYSLQVSEAAYSCDWLDASARFKHALRMIISRSQRELCVKAAGVPLSRRTFRTSLQVGEAAYAAYSCDWLEASARFKHALRMIISRSQRELCVKAAGVPLSRRTFRTITRAGYYLQMMLANFYHGVKIVGHQQ